MRKKRQPRPTFLITKGCLFVNNIPLTFPNLVFIKEIGKGANGVVFEANDNLLGRKVAVKVWKRTIPDAKNSRATSEAKKLAKLTHPLVVTVHQFDVINQYPYAVMEVVNGSSLKQWLLKDPSSVNDRCALWILFSTALRHIYRLGTFHGDPHTGNALVFEDYTGTYRGFIKIPDHREPSRPLALKVMDAGTSNIWADQSKFKERESHTLIETVGRMFSDPPLDSTVDLKGDEHPYVLLPILDHYVQYVTALSDIHTIRSLDHLEDTEDELCSTLAGAPYFRLNNVLEQLEEKEFSKETAAEIVRRAVSILGYQDKDQNQSGVLSPKEIVQIENFYAGCRKTFIEKCLKS